MLAHSIRILNFDQSVASQQNLLLQYKHELIDFTDLAGKVRLWADKKRACLIEERLRHSRPNQVTFIGSGDFHHISSLLLNQIEAQICLIVFDFHPDWEILPPRIGCGSWVSRALERNNIERIVLIGVSSDDIAWPSLQSANLAALKSNRLEIYPYSHGPSEVFFRNVADNVSIRSDKHFLHTTIHWSELGKSNLSQFIFSLLERINTRQVYISIDKDCLKKEYAATNWEEGGFSLDELLLMLKVIKENRDILGLDIVGDYSQIAISSKIKTFFSRLDHPRKPSADGLSLQRINEINEATNLKILQLLF